MKNLLLAHAENYIEELEKANYNLEKENNELQHQIDELNSRD